MPASFEVMSQYRLLPKTTSTAPSTWISYPQNCERDGTKSQRPFREACPRWFGPKTSRVFLHCHSNYSDGTSTVADWAEAGAAAGFDYVGITDHSAAATYAGGLYTESISAQHDEIDEANAKATGVRILKGVEVDILEDGTLDYDEPTRARFDFIIASVHNRFGHTEEQMTKRVLTAMDDPYMTILGHPTGRLLLSRRSFPMDLEAILRRAAERGIAVEINADPRRLDLEWRVVRHALNMGVTISIGADAHSTSGIPNMDVGIQIARKGWAAPEQILNTRALPDFLAFAHARRAVT